MSKRTQYQNDPAIEILTGVCPHDCPDSCSWQVAVARAGGRAVDIWGHPDHPVTQGRLCGKVDRYLERVYHPDRLATPMKRIGQKGSGQFAPVTWEAAMQDIGARLRAITHTFGAESVLPYSYAGTMGLLQGEGMASRFFNQLGASHLARTICAEAGFHGYVHTIGATEGTDTPAFAHARLILIWGSNTLTSNLHLWPFVQAARANGAQVIVIDPARTRTAQAADEWIPINPGTDAALALAMMNVIVAEGLHDTGYIARHTVGFAALSTRLAEWPPERAAGITGVPAERIRELARAYATTRPAAIRVNYGLQRHYGGGMAMRTIACLPALIGSWREYGGGIQLSSSGWFRHLDRTGLYRPDLGENQEELSIVNGQLSTVNGEKERRRPRILNMNRLGDALSMEPERLARAYYHPRPVDSVTRAEDAWPPVKALIVYNSNPAAVCPDQAAVVAGLQREELFTIVLEQFQTDTADYADYVLPATTQLEHWDMLKPYGHLYLALNRPAIAPLGESLPNTEIFRRLAQAMGFTDPCFRETDEEMLQALLAAQTHERFAGITWERLLAEGFVRLNVPDPATPFAEGGFPTPSGKCEFYSERMLSDGYDPLPGYTAPRWVEKAEWLIINNQYSMVNDGDGDRPLVCISPPAHSFLNSTFANLPRFVQREEQPVVRMHPDDARKRNLTAGDTVRLVNEYGEVTLVLDITEGVIPGTVLAPGVWWAKLSPDGRNINRTTAQDEADMGAGAVFYDTLVRVEKIITTGNREGAGIVNNQQLIPND